jgi:DNA-binding NtrC family response regulator
MFNNRGYMENISTNFQRVLFIDDDINFLASVKRTLRQEGYEVVTRNSPKEALALLYREHFDMVVSDQHMPEMNGVKLLELVRDLSPTTVRILLTGRMTVTTAKCAINQAAVAQILEKPCSHLPSTIKYLLKSNN